MSLISARRIYLTEKDNDALSIVCKLFFGWAVRDRFGILNVHSPFEWTTKNDPILAVPSERLVLSEIVDVRAHAILSEHANGDVVVSWSGGVDSTAVICALLKNGLPTNRLHVVCAESSPEEYPWFYRHLIDRGVRVTVTDKLVITLNELECSVIVNGWCADQLFGSNIHLRDLSLYNAPWVDALRSMFEQSRINLSARSYEYLEAVYTDYAKRLGFPIEQWCEFAWLFNFGVKWTYVQHDQNLALAGGKNAGKAVAFFDTQDFQRYSMQRFDRLRERNVNKLNRFYKRQLKQYIYEYTNDSEYFNHKGKRNSWAMVGEDLNQVAVFTESGVRLFRVKGETNGEHFGQLQRQVGDMFRKRGKDVTG